MKKIITINKTKWFWLYFIVGALFIAGFVFLAPIWGGTDVPWKSWGQDVIYLIMAMFLCLYLGGYLLKRLIKRKKATIYILAIIEFGLLAVLAILCIVSMFAPSLPSFFTVSRILGAALFLRGEVGCFTGYFSGIREENSYPLWAFCLSIVLFSLGVFFMSTEVVEETAILWIFVIMLLLLGILSFVVAFLAKPEKKKKTNA